MYINDIIRYALCYTYLDARTRERVPIQGGLETFPREGGKFAEGLFGEQAEPPRGLRRRRRAIVFREFRFGANDFAFQVRVEFGVKGVVVDGKSRG